MYNTFTCGGGIIPYISAHVFVLEESPPRCPFYISSSVFSVGRKSRTHAEEIGNIWLMSTTSRGIIECEMLGANFLWSCICLPCSHRAESYRWTWVYWRLYITFPIRIYSPHQDILAHTIRIQSANTLMWEYTCRCIKIQLQVDRNKPPPPGGFPIYYVPSSRTVSKRTPLEEPCTNPSRGVLLHKVLDEAT